MNPFPDLTSLHDLAFITAGALSLAFIVVMAILMRVYR